MIEYLDTSNLTRGWSRLTEIPGPGMRYGMSGAGLASHNKSGQIFVVGGVGKGAILQAVSTVLAYDIKSNSWSRISSMNKVNYNNIVCLITVIKCLKLCHIEQKFDVPIT